MAQSELLKCNLQSCRTILEENAFITCCSHIFCTRHGQISGSNAKCLACGTKFKDKADISIIELQPSDQSKSMMLSGLNPDQVLEIANRSISFYTYQLFNENRLKDELLKQSKEEINNLQNYCTQLQTKHRLEIENHQRTANDLKKDVEEKMRELEKQREQICQYSRLSKKLQLEVASCKRQIVSLKIRNQEDGIQQNHLPTRKYDFNLNSKRNEKEENNFFNYDLFSQKWPEARYSN